MKKKKTTSFTFVLPMLFDSRGHIPSVKDCYIRAKGKDDKKEHIFLLVDKGESDKDLGRMRNNPYYEEEEEVDNANLLITFKAPDEYKREYDLFLESKYSEFSESFKQRILRFHGITKTHNVGKVLYRSEDLYKKWEERLNVDISRDLEIGSKIKMKRETFDKSKIYGESATTAERESKTEKGTSK